jgi:hypothetical protein
MSESAGKQSDLSSRVIKTASIVAGRFLNASWKSFQSPDARRLGTVGVFLAIFFYVSVLVQRDVHAMKSFQVPLSALNVSPPPDFLTQQAATDVKALALPRGGKGFTAFDERLVPTMAYVLEALPWVDKVESLRFEYPGKIRFSLSILKPLALVRSKPGVSVAVARDGRRFPRSYIKGFKDDGCSRLPLITGLKLGPSGRDLMLSTLAFIQRLRDQSLLSKAKVKVIDVSNYGGRLFPKKGEIRLITETGAIIEWGRLEDTARVHVSFAKKSMKLQRFLREGPDMKTVTQLSLRWDEIVYTIKPRATATVAQR